MLKTLRTTLLALTLGFSSTAAFAEIVNINTADLKTLQTHLKGIGEKKAQAIIDYRTAKGGFKTIEEIQEVKGIGAKLFERNKADLSLTESAGTPNTPLPSTTTSHSATTSTSLHTTPLVNTTPLPPATTPAATKPITQPVTTTTTVSTTAKTADIKTQ